MEYYKEMDLVGGGRCYSLQWNDPSVFKSKVVVVLLVNKNADGLKESVNSVLGQVVTVPISLLIINDSQDNNWARLLDEKIMDSRIVVAGCECGKAWKARNIAHRIIWTEFKEFEWICRLDCDDKFATKNVITSTLAAIESTKPDAHWALSANRQIENGRLNDLINRPSTDLFEPEYLLKRLNDMKEGILDGELPSCNLWVRNGMRCHYPGVDSAEDHWLVANLLVTQKEEGCILPDIVHTDYKLYGTVTMNNVKKGLYQHSRELLYLSVRQWLGHDVDDEGLICLGWGGEGSVWLKDGICIKRFYDSNLTDDQAIWHGKINNGRHLPDATWKKINNRWEAHYKYLSSSPCDNISISQISRFIRFCIDAGIVCLNITRKNFRLLDGELFFVDIGRFILPLELRYFRDMCARLYLLFVKGYSDVQLDSITHEIRNNVGRMRSIDGFEDFFHREVHLWFMSHGQHAKPFRNVLPGPRHHEDVTIMIKCCSMEAHSLEKQCNHIFSQICQSDSYAEKILLVDSFKSPFLRQYDEGDFGLLMEKARKLVADGIIDEIWITPDPEDKGTNASINKDWFGVDCDATHTIKGVPLTPQLWGFENVKTRYVLQMDADVIIGRDQKHNVIGEMLEAIKKEKVFGVGFNIPQPKGATFKPYDGQYVPEVRLGLIDLERLKKNRPFPNDVEDGKLTLGWYRSVEKYQGENDWRSLRGGDPRSYYIHPLNDSKRDIVFLDRVTDLVEQGIVPKVQRSEWDLKGDYEDWCYNERKEPIVVLIYGTKTEYHWARACLKSLFMQEDVDWGAIVIDDCSDYSYQSWLFNQIEQNRERITLVRLRSKNDNLNFINNIVSEICINLEQIVIGLKIDEVMMHPHVIKEIFTQFKNKQGLLWTNIYLANKPLGLDKSKPEDQIPDIITDRYGLPIQIRAVRHNDIDLLLSVLGYANEQGRNEVANVDDNALVIPKYSFYNNKKGKNETKTLRPTIYIPNLNRIEIDITYDCNLRCPGCCRSCSQAPCKIHMPLEMIDSFINETEINGIEWESVHILGGEPTLHPEFHEIIQKLDEWFEKYSPNTDLKVISNGAGKRVNDALAEMPTRWLYNRSFKNDSSTDYFEPFNQAPIDLEKWKDEDFRKGCWITQDSGIGLTPLGYFHCAIAGGIERIMQFGKGLDRIPKHPWEFLDIMDTYCRFCGHFLNDIYHNRLQQRELSLDPNTMSKSWIRAYDTWPDRKSKIKLERRKKLRQALVIQENKKVRAKAETLMNAMREDGK